jgi:hypothetical protein
MKAARRLPTPSWARQILEALEAVRENLLPLSDDIWDSILRHDQAFRDLAARHWREGRRMLRSLPEPVKIEVVTA